MLVWMGAQRRPKELGRNIRCSWKDSSALVGPCPAPPAPVNAWLQWTMTLQTAAAVKALAQVEMIFTFASSVLVFREHVNRLEISGCILIVAGILVLLLL